MNFKNHSYLSILAAGLFCAASATAQTESNFQSSARPFGLDIVDTVQLAGSDTASATFQADSLPSINQLINSRLGESVEVANAAAYALDPAKLMLATAGTARVYFVGEGAGYHNTLGFNTLASGDLATGRGLTSTSQLIFPDVTSSNSMLNPSNTPVRSISQPLLPGDFVDLGHFAAGSTLDFFLIADGANGGQNVYAHPKDRNPDQKDHLVAFAIPNSPFLLLGFEDLFNGGDRDYNDAMFVVDIGYENIQKLISAPEPTTCLILAGFLGIVIARRRRDETPTLA